MRLYYRYLPLEAKHLAVHSYNIIHGDLHCVSRREYKYALYLNLRQNNVLIDGDRAARLVDFGFASLVGIIPDALSYLARSTARPGALRWAAPEKVLPKKGCKLTTKSDIYSFGCISLQECLLV